MVTAEEDAGTVLLTFVGHNGHPYGAANIKEIRLNQPGVTGVIQELHIAHNLGDLGPIQVARIEGTCTVENEITNDVHLDSLYGELWCLAGLPSLTVSDPTPGPAGTRILIGGVPFAEPPRGGDFNGSIDVAGDVEYLYLDDALKGTVHIGGDLIDCCLYGIPSSGELLIDQDLLGMTRDPVFGGSSLRGRIEVGGNFDAIVYLGSRRSLAGELAIGGDFAGSIDTWYGEVSGTVHVGGDFTGNMTTYSADLSGDIVVDGDLTGGIGIGMSPDYLVEPALTGSVTVQGDMTGVISICGDLHDPTDPNDPDPQLSGGHIIINGSFGTSQYVSAINIGGTMSGPRPFVAVDYDGWDQPDNWEWWGFVQIFTPDPNDPNAPPLMLRSNTPAWHVWEITECRGDMNNDGAVDFGDINPFVQALSYVRAYSLDFPGLGALEDPWDPNAGSRVYHGDCNCDGVFDFGDINPFIELVAQPQPCCSHECPCTAGGGGLMAMPEPEYLAAKLAVNVKPELFDDLVAMAAAAASVQTDPKLKTYWEKVHHTLAP